MAMLALAGLVASVGLPIVMSPLLTMVTPPLPLGVTSMPTTLRPQPLVQATPISPLLVTVLVSGAAAQHLNAAQAIGVGGDIITGCASEHQIGGVGEGHHRIVLHIEGGFVCPAHLHILFCPRGLMIDRETARHIRANRRPIQRDAMIRA